MNILRQHARNASVLALQSILQRGLGLLTGIALARGLGPTGLGVFNAVQATATNAYGFLRLGLDAGIHVSMAQVSEAGRPVEKGSILAAGALLLALAGLTAALICLGFANWLARVVFNEPELGRWLRVASALVAAQFASQFSYAALAGLHRFIPYARVMSVSSAANLVFVMVGVYVGKLTGALIAVSIVAGTNAVWLVWELARALREEQFCIRFTRVMPHARELLSFGLPFYVAGLIAIPVTYYMQGRVSALAGLKELGYLRVVSTITALVTFIPASIAGSTISTLVAVDSNPSLGDRVFFSHAALNLKAVWLFGLIVAVCADLPLVFLLPVVFGSPYQPAVVAARIGLFAAVSTAVEGVTGQILTSRRRMDLVFYLGLVRSITFGATAWNLIPHYGLEGYLVAEFVAAALSVAIFLVLGYLAGRGRITDMAPLLAVAGLNVAAVTVLVLIDVLRPNAIAQGGLKALLIAAVFAGGYRWVLASTEREVLRRIAAECALRVRRLVSGSPLAS